MGTSEQAERDLREREILWRGLREAAESVLANLPGSYADLQEAVCLTERMAADGLPSERVRPSAALAAATARAEAAERERDNEKSAAVAMETLAVGLRSDVSRLRDERDEARAAVAEAEARERALREAATPFAEDPVGAWPWLYYDGWACGVCGGPGVGRGEGPPTLPCLVCVQRLAAALAQPAPSPGAAEAGTCDGAADGTEPSTCEWCGKPCPPWSAMCKTCAAPLGGLPGEPPSPPPETIACGCRSRDALTCAARRIGMDLLAADAPCDCPCHEAETEAPDGE